MPYADPKMRLERKKREYRRNPEIFKDRVRRYRSAHSLKVKEANRQYQKRYAQTKKGKIKTRRRDQKDCLMLTDRYVRDLLSKNTYVKKSAWPQILVEAKRAELKLRRKLDEYN